MQFVKLSVPALFLMLLLWTILGVLLGRYLLPKREKKAVALREVTLREAVNERVQFYHEKLDQLVLEAMQDDMVLTVETKPTPGVPPAMGHISLLIGVRPRLHLIRAVMEEDKALAAVDNSDLNALLAKATESANKAQEAAATMMLTAAPNMGGTLNL